MDVHPLAEYWPEMPADEFQEFIADVMTHGVREPIVIFEGMVLDGRHRHKASTIAGVPCPSIPYDGDDPAGFVISRNAHRRQLTKADRARAVLQCREWQTTGRHKVHQDDEPSDGEAPRTREQLAQEAGVSTATIDRERRNLRVESGEAEPPPAPKPPEPAETAAPEAANPPPVSNGQTPNGDEKIDPADEINARTASEAQRQDMKQAAQEERIRDLEAEKVDLEERLAVASAGEDDNAAMVQAKAWQEERKALKQQIANWQRQYESAREDASRQRSRAAALAKENDVLKARVKALEGPADG